MAASMARRRGLQEGSGVKSASKAGTGRHQKHEQGWELGSPVLTIGLGVAAAEDEAWSRGSRWTSTRWCSYVDVAGSSGSACGGCRGRAREGAAMDNVEDNTNIGERWCSRTRGRRAVVDRLSAAMSVKRRGEAGVVATYVAATQSWVRRRKTVPWAQPQVRDSARRVAREHGVAGSAAASAVALAWRALR